MNPTEPEHLQGTMHGFSIVLSWPQQKRQLASGCSVVISFTTGFASFRSC